MQLGAIWPASSQQGQPLCMTQAGKRLRCPTYGCSGFLTSAMHLGMEHSLLQKREIYQKDPPAKPVKASMQAPPQGGKRKGRPASGQKLCLLPLTLSVPAGCRLPLLVMIAALDAYIWDGVHAVCTAAEHGSHKPRESALSPASSSQVRTNPAASIS